MFLKVMLFLGLVNTITFIVSLLVSRGAQLPPVDIELRDGARVFIGSTFLLGILWMGVIGFDLIFFNL